MDSVKYIGMDVHKEAISIAVLNSSGKLVMECIVETKAATILQFVHGLRGNVHVTLEEPEKAIGEKSPIEPWLARHNALLVSLESRRKKSHIYIFRP